MLNSDVTSQSVRDLYDREGTPWPPRRRRKHRLGVVAAPVIAAELIAQVA